MYELTTTWTSCRSFAEKQKVGGVSGNPTPSGNPLHYLTHCPISLPLLYTCIPLDDRDGWAWLFPKADSATACLKFVLNAGLLGTDVYNSPDVIDYTLI